MATTPPNQPKGFTLSFPTSLSLKDLITIVSVVVSLTVAWGTFSTRIAIVEKEQVRMAEILKKYADTTARMQRQLRRLEAHQQDDELLLDQVFILLKRPLPKRRADGTVTE